MLSFPVILLGILHDSFRAEYTNGLIENESAGYTTLRFGGDRSCLR